MSAIILDGTKIAAQIKAEVGEEVKELTAAEFGRAWPSFSPDTIPLRRSTFATR